MMVEYPHPTCDSDTFGPNHGGDLCPICGEALAYDDIIRHLSTGETGRLLDVAPDDVSQPLAHPSCYREWTEKQTRTLDEFT